MGECVNFIESMKYNVFVITKSCELMCCCWFSEFKGNQVLMTVKPFVGY